MKTPSIEIVPRRPSSGSRRRGATLLAIGASLALFATAGLRAAESTKTFASPEEAAAALRAAVNHPDNTVLRDLIGSAADDIIPSDAVQAKNEQIVFAAGLNATNRLVRESETKYVVESGPGYWPFPVPIVNKNGRWFFDGVAGKDELLNRRVGNNELSTLNTLRASVQAQREYSSQDQDGDEVLEFAQKFSSTPGRKDGLFWEPDLDGTISPLGPLVAAAQAEGYGGVGASVIPPQPYHGYHYKVLTRQGKHAPGGKYDYIINGHMIGGFAFVAWPSNYGESGVMTFIVNQQGKVFQKDLGPKTASIVKGMKTYDPDQTWTLSKD